MINHLTQCDRNRGRLPLDDHGETVADENGIDSRGVQDPCPEMVIGGQHRQLPSRLLGFDKLWNGDWPSKGTASPFVSARWGGILR